MLNVRDDVWVFGSCQMPVATCLHSVTYFRINRGMESIPLWVECSFGYTFETRFRVLNNSVVVCSKWVCTISHIKSKPKITFETICSSSIAIEHKHTQIVCTMFRCGDYYYRAKKNNRLKLIQSKVILMCLRLNSHRCSTFCGLLIATELLTEICVVLSINQVSTKHGACPHMHFDVCHSICIIWFSLYF